MPRLQATACPRQESKDGSGKFPPTVPAVTGRRQAQAMQRPLSLFILLRPHLSSSSSSCPSLIILLLLLLLLLRILHELSEATPNRAQEDSDLLPRHGGPSRQAAHASTDPPRDCSIEPPPSSDICDYMMMVLLLMVTMLMIVMTMMMLMMHLGLSWSAFGQSWSPLESLSGRLGSQRSWTSTVFEDVSGESLIFSIKRLKTKLSTFHFSEDVSGETAIFEYSGYFATHFNIPFFGGCLRRNAHFQHKTS